MANLEHLAILRGGVQTWNRWRRDNPDIDPDLSEANLSRMDLNRANLSEVNLWAAILSMASFRRANLDGANLISANLWGADLGEASLSRANLAYIDVRYGQLSRCDLTSAKLTGAMLYATTQDDWIIQGVECEYVFWDADAKVRSPKDRDFDPGEFERLYRTRPTIEYVFENGMTLLDPLLVDRVVQTIREQNPEFDIKIDSISTRGLAPSITFTVRQEEHKNLALQMVVAGYESRSQRLGNEKDRLCDLLDRAIDEAGRPPTEAGPGTVAAMDSGSVNIERHIHHAVELQQAIAELPENSPAFARVARKTALNIIGSATKNVAKGRVQEAARQIYELGKDLGPMMVNTAAYAFFKNCLR